MFTVFVLILVVNAVQGQSACEWGDAQSGTGLGGNKLTQRTTKSLSNPEWMNDMTFEENVAFCRLMCEEMGECTGLQFSPTYWNHQECFLMDGTDTYSRSGWSTSLKDCPFRRSCAWGDAMSGTGLNGDKLTQRTTSSLSNPEWMNDMTFEENVAVCIEQCEENRECTGLQFSPTSWNHQECFLMNGDATYSRSGWSTTLLTCEVACNVEWGEAQSGKGLNGDKLSQRTTSSISNPEWMNGYTFAENVEICRTSCAENKECTGLQFSPTTWDHQECFLMNGDETYNRSGWSTSLKNCAAEM